MTIADVLRAWGEDAWGSLAMRLAAKLREDGWERVTPAQTLVMTTTLLGGAVTLPDGTVVAMIEMAGGPEVEGLAVQVTRDARLSEAYGWWEEPLRVADDGEHARYRQNRQGVLPPPSWWRTLPCGHPQSPVAWLMPSGLHVCHCGTSLADNDLMVAGPGGEHPDGDVVSCYGCGCYVLVLDP